MYALSEVSLNNIILVIEYLHLLTNGSQVFQYFCGQIQTLVLDDIFSKKRWSIFFFVSFDILKLGCVANRSVLRITNNFIVI